MPKLKGSNPKAKTRIYNNLTKVKKPTRQEQENRHQAWQQRLAEDERASEMTEQVHANQSLFQEMNVPASLRVPDDGEEEQPNQSVLVQRRGDEEMKNEDDETVLHGNTTPVRRRMNLRPRDRTPPTGQSKN